VSDLLHTVLDALSKFSGHDCTPSQRNNRQWYARCPAHRGRNRNLDIGIGNDGRVLIHCFRGCKPEQVLDALDMRMVDLYPPDTRQTKPPKPVPPSEHEDADYFYRDKDGVGIFKIERRYGKNGRYFVASHKDAEGKWQEADGPIVRSYPSPAGEG
jgi:hypothetical protein